VHTDPFEVEAVLNGDWQIAEVVLDSGAHSRELARWAQVCLRRLKVRPVATVEK
jgi:hypothetical protein